MARKCAGLVLAVLLVASLCGCGLKKDPPKITARPTRPTVPTNPYNARDFEFDGRFLHCTAGESLAGIDVSAHQGQIDWQQVKDYGVEFAFIRLGYRGYDTGEICVDEYAAYNLEQARKAGLLVGAYFFSQAINEQEALEEANFALDVLNGFQLDLPLVYDWEHMVEEDARTDHVKKDELMVCVKTYCAAVERSGYRAMVYFNRSLAGTHLELAELTEYPFWLAAYTDSLNYPYRMEFWQYTETGSVAGIEGPVDLDIWLPLPQMA